MSDPASFIGRVIRQEPGDGRPVPFTSAHERPRRIATPRSDGRCLIAGGYEDDREVERLQQHRKIPNELSRRPGTIEDGAGAWPDGRAPASQSARVGGRDDGMRQRRHLHLRIALPFLPRRFSRGSAELFGVLLLMALAFAVLAHHHRERVTAALAERDEAAGRLLAAWFLAAHRTVQEGTWPQVPGTAGSELLPGNIVAPPGLRPDGRIRLGLVDDGNGVAMAFAVFTPRGGEAVRRVRSGAIDGGLARLEEAGVTSGPMARHRAAIETVLGAPLEAGALYLTADAGLVWRNGILHRRPQPGRPWLNRMEGDIDAGSFSITGVAAMRAGAAASSRSSTAGSARVTGSVEGASLDGGRLEAAGLEAASLGIERDLAVGSLAAAGRVTAAGATAATGLLGASLEADDVAAQTLAAGAGVRVTGSAALRDVAAGRLEARSLSAPALDTGRLFGPRLRVAGTLVVGRCRGC